MPDAPDTYIARLEDEKKAMEVRVAELQAEIRTINNLIYRRKSELFAESREEKVNQKNVDRLFFETLIMDAISNTKRGLRTGEIHTAITKSGYGLNYNTLRSYIAKMRDKGLIKKATPSSYYWVVVEKPTNG
jgi:predicted transcriptional regulator